MIVLFRDSSVNYWLNNSVVDCGNVDAQNSNLEIVFPPDDDYEMIAKQIKENDENEKKIYNTHPSKSYKKKYNNTINESNNSIKIAHELDAYIRPQEGYSINTKTNNKKFKPVYYKKNIITHQIIASKMQRVME